MPLYFLSLAREGPGQDACPIMGICPKLGTTFVRLRRKREPSTLQPARELSVNDRAVMGAGFVVQSQFSNLRRQQQWQVSCTHELRNRDD